MKWVWAGFVVIIWGNGIVAKRCNEAELGPEDHRLCLCDQGRQHFRTLWDSVLQKECLTCLQQGDNIFLVKGFRVECSPCHLFPYDSPKKFFALHYVALETECHDFFVAASFRSKDIGCGKRAVLPRMLLDAMRDNCVNPEEYIYTWTPSFDIDMDNDLLQISEEHDEDETTIVYSASSLQLSAHTFINEPHFSTTVSTPTPLPTDDAFIDVKDDHSPEVGKEAVGKNAAISWIWWGGAGGLLMILIAFALVLSKRWGRDLKMLMSLQ